AHIAVYAIGAYTTALLLLDYPNLNFFICFFASGLAGFLCALLLAYVSVRLKSDYFAIATLGLAYLVLALLINWKSLTRGVLGIPGIPRPRIGSFVFIDNYHFLLLVFALDIVILGLLYALFKSSIARRLKASSEYEEAAEALAIDVLADRRFSFLVASVGAGFAGSLFSYYFSFIEPFSFSLNEMLFVFSIVIIGSPGSFWGVLAATIFLVLLPEPLRFTGEVQGWIETFFHLPEGGALKVPVLKWVIAFFNFTANPSVLGPMRQMLYAIILFLVVYINRKRLFATLRSV
ncbi:MAG: branched-chain amino acid ABC transporter permease, partial [Candidatus Dadabacteria bacterium]